MSTRNRIFELLRNFSYSLISNLISLVISTLVVLIIPKFIDVESYGYWQLYVFYSSYVGLLHFGWNDGIYLKEGGNNYADINKQSYFSQFYLLLISQFIIALFGFGFTYFYVAEENKRFVLYSTAICLILVNCRYMLLFLLQATNRIKDYSIVTISDRILYALFIAGLILFKFYDFKLMTYMDLLSKGISLLIAIYYCRDIVFQKFAYLRLELEEIKENILSGIKLMFSNIASKLIIGNIRFGIERMWTVAVFGQVSLTLSISGFMMLFINAVGIVLFPFLRNVKKENLNQFYVISRDSIVIIMFLFLFLYFPVIQILKHWLPKYNDGLIYLSILFPMCLFEGKMSMLVSTYLKVLREEKFLLMINVVSLIASLIVGSITIYLLKNLDLTVFGIIFLVAFRCVFAEIFISKKLNLNIIKDISQELLLTVVFICSCWFLSPLYALLVYTCSFIFYLFYNYNSFKITFANIKRYIGK